MPARLVVEVAAALGSFQADFNKASSIANTTAKSIQTSIDEITSKAANLGKILTGAISVHAFADWAHETVSAAASLADFSAQTGSSVESLSKLRNQAKIIGADFGTLQAITLKLAAGMAGVDDENSKVARGLAALGIAERDPAAALQEIAVKLDKYQDGIGKAALARDLFGKTGPAFLSTLKDMARLQDVAATTTAQQAEEAKRLEEALRRLTAQANIFKTVLLSDVVPEVANWAEAFREARKEGLGFFAALNVGTTYSDRIGPSLDDTRKKLAALNEELAYNKKHGLSADYVQPAIDDAQRKLNVLLSMQRTAAMAGAAKLGYTGDVRDYQANKKPELDYTGAKDKPAGPDEFARFMKEAGKAAADAQIAWDDLGKAIDEKTSPAMKRLIEIEGDPVFKSLPASQREAIESLLLTADATEHLTASWTKETDAAMKAIEANEKMEEARAKLVERNVALVGGYQFSNDALAREIGITGDDDLAHRKLAATLEYEKLKRDALANSAGQPALDALDAEYQKRLKLLDVQDRANKQAEDVAALKGAFGSAFDNSFADFVTGTKSAKDAFKSFTSSLEQDLARIAAKKLREALWDSIFGSSSGSGGTSIGGLLSKLFGGSSGGEDPGWTPDDTFVEGAFPGYAQGTAFAPGGLAWVGEHGRELVNLPRGAQVIPNHMLTARRADSGGGGITVHQTVQFIHSGPVDRHSQKQLALAAGRGIHQVAYHYG